MDPTLNLPFFWISRGRRCDTAVLRYRIQQLTMHLIEGAGAPEEQLFFSNTTSNIASHNIRVGLNKAGPHSSSATYCAVLPAVDSRKNQGHGHVRHVAPKLLYEKNVRTAIEVTPPLPQGTGACSFRLDSPSTFTGRQL